MARSKAVRPATTTAAVYYGPGDLRLDEVPLPSLGRGELLVRITACGLCPSEIMDWYMSRKAPVPLGHEPVGEVVEAADGADFRSGERVFVHHHAPCFGCHFCRRGDYVQCATWGPRRLLPGGLATYAVVQPPAVASDVFRLPAGMADDVATFIEPLACVVKSIRRARVRDGDHVLVIGLGVMGLLHLLALRVLAKPARLLAADRIPARLDRGAAMADVVIDTSRAALRDAVGESTEGRGADVVIVGPGSIEALESARRAAAPGGTVLVFTPAAPGEVWPVPVHEMFFNETAIVPSYSAGPDDTREAARLLAAGLPVEPLITHRLPLAEASWGYQLVRDAGATLKVIVHP